MVNDHSTPDPQTQPTTWRSSQTAQDWVHGTATQLAVGDQFDTPTGVATVTHIYEYEPGQFLIDATLTMPCNSGDVFHIHRADEAGAGQ